jgi:hypothetical protein
VSSVVEASFFGTEWKRRSWGTVKAEGTGCGESRGGYWEGETPESFNPKDGFGMKQGRADEGGTTRHEVEKA